LSIEVYGECTTLHFYGPGKRPKTSNIMHEHSEHDVQDFETSKNTGEVNRGERCKFQASQTE
jgi:hypothetical protein